MRINPINEQLNPTLEKLVLVVVSDALSMTKPRNFVKRLLIAVDRAINAYAADLEYEESIYGIPIEMKWIYNPFASGKELRVMSARHHLTNYVHKYIEENFPEYSEQVL
ncbi:hypothetical protein HYT57_03355 [Candidatus Woesearchaeota archaeon]|nr:hypothetical protein [Candidatus Woesearchaeota archaeon]